MGNYLASFPYMKNGYEPENNNAMKYTTVAVCTDEPRAISKISNYLNSADVSKVLAMKRLQNECKKDSSVMMYAWNKLNNLFSSPFALPKIDIAEDNGQIDSVEESCLKYFVKPTCQKLWKKEREAESDDFIGFRFNSKQSPKDCFKLSQERPLANFIFQRLDSGIDESPYPSRIHTQIDLDSLYLAAKITMADSQHSCRLFKENFTHGIGGTREYHESISFFIDIRDPLCQKPLGEEYKFSAFGECDSMFSYDSMFSDISFENSNGNCLDDDFIVFEEHSSDEDGYDFNFTLNDCTTVGLSCSVSENSTTCLDICMDTSMITSNSVRLREQNSESKMSLKIGISPSSSCEIHHESAIFKKNSSNADGCPDVKDDSAGEVTSENICIARLKTSTNYFDACTTSEKTTSVTQNGDSSSTGCCSILEDSSTSEVSSKKTCKKSRKKVCFEKDDDLVVVYQMRHWDFAYRDARKGLWELAAVDRCRFWRRVKELESVLTPCLKKKLDLIEKPSFNI